MPFALGSSHGNLCPARPAARSARAGLRVLPVLASLGALAAALTGCSMVTGPEPARTAPTTHPVPTTAPPTLVPGGSATENLPFFSAVLQQFAAGQEPVQGQPVVNALVSAGFDPLAMQVSFDQTMTGLTADNIFVSVRIGHDCLLGQIVTTDREVVAKTAPAVGPDSAVCLIGKTRTIDWNPAS